MRNNSSFLSQYNSLYGWNLTPLTFNQGGTVFSPPGLTFKTVTDTGFSTIVKSSQGQYPPNGYTDLFWSGPKTPFSAYPPPGTIFPIAPTWGFHSGFGSWGGIQGYNSVERQVIFHIGVPSPFVFYQWANSAICVVSGSYLSDFYPTPGAATIGIPENDPTPVSGFARSMLVAPNSCLGIMWHNPYQGGTDVDLRRAAVGSPLGVALVDAFNSKIVNDVRTSFILGDPTLQF
jgi:hypothetical protein